MSQNLADKFKQAFKKLSLTGVKDIGVLRLCNGIQCVKLVGRFETSFNSIDPIDSQTLLVMMRSFDFLPGCSFKYKKRIKVLINGNPRCYLYEFYATPRSICGADIRDGVFYLYVVGYGRETPCHQTFFQKNS